MSRRRALPPARAIAVLVVLALVPAPSTAAAPPASSVEASARAAAGVPPAPERCAAGPVERCRGVLVVGVAGLRWDDLGPGTPALASLAATAAVGALSVKALPAVTCPADGWLTLGAGARAKASSSSAREPCGASLTADDQDVQRNAGSRDGASLAALATALDGRVQTSGPGAQLAVDLPGEQPPAAPGAPVVIVDGGVLANGADRPATLLAADEVVGEAVISRPPDVDLLVVGLSEGDGGSRAHLHVALATGPSFPRGALTSASTRREPFVQLIDVAPTVLDLLGRPVPDVMDGQPWRVRGPAPSVAQLVDLDRRAQAWRAAVVPFFVVVYLATIALFLLALWRRRPQAAELVALTSTGILGASYLANLVPWWRTGRPVLALLAVAVPLAAAVAAAALAAGRRQVLAPAGAVCAFVATVLIGDLLTGAALQIDSVAGYSPLVGGRFAGIGNLAFGVLAAAVLLATAALVRGAAALAGIGILAVVVDGAPPWGSDVGGVLALVPAFVLLVLLRTGRRVSALRLGIAAAAGAVVVAVFALADWSRPATDRTHLGRFVQDLLDGTAVEVLRRKADAVFGLLFLNPVTSLLPLVVAAVVYVVVRPPPPLRRAFETAPAWRHGLLALGLACLLGFALNDSGAAVPALAVCVAVPATAAVVVRAWRSPGASAASTPATPVA